MEMIKAFANLAWAVFIELINNPFILILLILILLLKIFYSKLRGIIGEFWVRLELRKLPRKEYIVLNDIMIEQNNMTHQIDHIVVSKYGLFVIEMKNYIGFITGDEYEYNWTKFVGKTRYEFQNPIRQNYGHVQALKELLKLNEEIFIPIVCFSNQATIKVKTNKAVVQLDGLNKLIRNFYKIQINDDIKEIANTIFKMNIEDKTKRKEHVNTIKKNINNDKELVDNNICPKCGGELVMRNGKRGTFLGCSNYPKCKYTKNRD